MAHTRLDPEARRRQLIELGLKMLSCESSEQVAIDRIAEAAGISRGLLFHYFPTKRDYHVAVVRAAADHMLEVTAPDPDLPVIERLRAGLMAYVDFVAANHALYVSLVRGAAGGDDELQQIFDQTRTRIVDRVVEALAMPPGGPAAVRTVLRGWVGFVEESTLDWLGHRDLERDALVTLQEQVLLSSIETAASVGGIPAR
jgi:AcrR family transcriptional regulator